MKKQLLIFILIFCAITQSDAQKYKYFTFPEKPEFEVTEHIKSLEEAVINKIYSSQYIVEENDEKQYIFTYTARWINSDEVIKRNNRVYLSASQGAEYLYQKARVIKPNGDIQELKKSDIKEGVLEENDQKYYYFALEGLEKGSIIETANYEKRNPNYYGSLVYLQEKVERMNQRYELICPSHLKFAFKSINNAPEMVYDTLTKEYNRWTVEVDSIGGVEAQPTMFDDVVKQGILSKLDRNIAKNTGDLTSYGSAARTVYSNLHPEFSKAQQKKLSKIAKEINLSSLKDETSKIQAIENYLKSNIQVVESPYSDLRNIDFILENKAANDFGITMLHVALLELAELKFEIILTSDRSNIRFDPDFEAYLFLDHYMIYFPTTDQYLAPTNNFLRAPIVPAEWTHNYGLFIKEVGVGDMKVPIGKVKFIEALPYSATKDEMDIEVKFEEDLVHPTISIEKSSSGYSAQYFQPYFHLMDEEALGNVKKSLVLMINEEIEAEEVELKNTSENDFGSKPFVYSFSTNEHSFVEKAGSDFLFKLGLLIGPQMEMYQEEERKYDVESENARFYGRKIQFNIPEGYIIKNLEDLKMEYKYGEEGKENLYFKSTYTKKGNQVTVECEEYYTEIVYPVSEFEKYQKVINAAADFNKIVLVLQMDKP